MKIRDLFEADVTRDIPPVVYFHEQSPEKVAAEVSEYIITGGYPEGDTRARRVANGIHEEFVRLLRNIRTELDKKGGTALPASWISGFYGSGKSSFAKLLGLALNGLALPDGTALSRALIRRDDSPRAKELEDAWSALVTKLQPISVVFDIGAVAQDNEHIHVAVLRQVQAQLGYCRRNRLVASSEIEIEREGAWPAFEAAVQKAAGKPWAKAKEEAFVEDVFSHALHVLHPERYREPMSWVDSHVGGRHTVGSSVQEVVETLAFILDLRAPGKTLFVVVDEVSQYIHQDENRMLKLQSFVSDLGQRLKGRVWLLATGQQKLEDAADADNIGKLKGRFPPSLRVHLGVANIRDVVHKRLLKKAPAKDPILRELFGKHRPELKLCGYGCETISEEDFVEIYPMLPAHIDLLLRITSNLRTRSTRVQGDDHAIRGLLQLLGELFRQRKLADRPVGDLVTLDEIFEVQQSALEPDVQTTLQRIFTHPDLTGSPLAIRAAKAVALLELIQEDGSPTTTDTVARCLYLRLGDGNAAPAVGEALEKLRAMSLLTYSEKNGYKVQSSAGQEWSYERENYGVTQQEISAAVHETLKNDVLGKPERPRLKTRSFPIAAWFSDGKQVDDQKLVDPREEAAFAIDLRYLTNREDRAAASWVQRSATEPLKGRMLWVIGDAGPIAQTARALGQSRYMIRRYEARRETLGPEKKRLYSDEQARVEELEKKLAAVTEEAFLDGAVYFQGRELRPRDLGGTFAVALTALGNRLLPELFPSYSDHPVSEGELVQLLEPQLAGPSTKFMEGGLGILALEGGRYVATCEGREPQRILTYIEEQKGVSGAILLSHFGRPPYGFAPDMVRACLAGLLRAGKIRIRPEEAKEITSFKDPGVRDLFLKDRGLRKADIFPARDEGLSARDKVLICTFFKEMLSVDVDREAEAIADAVSAHFPGKKLALEEVERALRRLPGAPEPPQPLLRLGRAMEDCRRSHHVAEIAAATRKNLDALRDGIEQLQIYRSGLTEPALAALNHAAEVRTHHLSQLRAFADLDGLDADARQLEQDLVQPRPWLAVATMTAAAGRLKEAYAEVRRTLLGELGRQAEAASARVSAREGFARLAPDDAHRVLRPLQEAVTTTSADAVHPTLVEVRDTFASRLRDAEERANQLLDELLSQDQHQQSVIRVETRLAGREIANRAQLDALLQEIEQAVMAQLDKNRRVRLV